MYWVGKLPQVAVQLPHRDEGVLAGAAPGGAQAEEMQGGRALGSDVARVGEVLVERDAGGGKVVEEVADDSDAVLVEIGFQHAAAQHGDQCGLARDEGAEAGLGPLRARALEGVHRAGNGGSEEGARMRLADQRLENRHAGLREAGRRVVVRGGKLGVVEQPLSIRLTVCLQGPALVVVQQSDQSSNATANEGLAAASQAHAR